MNKQVRESLEYFFGNAIKDFLEYEAQTFARKDFVFPQKDFVSKVHGASDRSVRVLRSLQTLFDHGALAGTGYLSILPVDQGVEHSAGASFAENPEYFHPENIVQLAVEGACNAVASTLGGLALCARKYAHKIPFILKINHNDLLVYPNRYDQILFAQVKQAFDMGAIAVGATIYFGSEESARQIQEVSEAFQQAHELGMATVLWCYLRNDAFQREIDYHLATDISAQANYLGATLQADIIKQKLPQFSHSAYKAFRFGKITQKALRLMGKGYHELHRVFQQITSRRDKESFTVALNPGDESQEVVTLEEMLQLTGASLNVLASDVYAWRTTYAKCLIDLARYQLAHCYMGRAGLIHSGGASGGRDVDAAVVTAAINKRAGGMGLISGRKAFQKPFKEGVALLQAIQEVYLAKEISLA